MQKSKILANILTIVGGCLIFTGGVLLGTEIAKPKKIGTLNVTEESNELYLELEKEVADVKRCKSVVLRVNVINK